MSPSRSFNRDPRNGVLPKPTLLDTISGRIRFLGVHVDLPTALFRDLLHLCSSVGLDDDALSAPLVALVAGLQAAVPSYRGLHLTLVENGHPVSVTAFLNSEDAESITTSLRVPFAALGSGFDPDSGVVFYAATPGAFVDLAADLGYALDTPTTTPDGPRSPAGDTDGDGQHNPGHRNGHPVIAVDANLPLTVLESGLTGLDEPSSINQAIGFLMDQRHPPEQAHATLSGGAGPAGVEPHIFAARLLRG